MSLAKWIPKKEYKRIFRQVPRVTADLVILNSRKEVLLSERDIPPRKGSWHLPGGMVRRGERVAQAALRIAKAETGLKIKLESCAGLFDSPKRVPRMHDITLVFKAKITGGKLKGSWQGQELKFFNTRKLPKMFFEHNKEVEVARKARGGTKQFYWKG